MNKTPRDEQGKPHGYWEKYINGKLWYKGCYVHGKQHGYWENYVYGQEYGYWEGYEYSYDDLTFKGDYINGFKYGYWDVYNENSKLTHKIFYYIDIEMHKTSNNKLIL